MSNCGKSSMLLLTFEQNDEINIQFVLEDVGFFIQSLDHFHREIFNTNLRSIFENIKRNIYV